MANVGGNNEEVYDVEMLNKDLLEAHHYTINSVQQVNASLKGEIKELHNETVHLVKKTNKLRAPYWWRRCPRRQGHFFHAITRLFCTSACNVPLRLLFLKRHLSKV